MKRWKRRAQPSSTFEKLAGGQISGGPLPLFRTTERVIVVSVVVIVLKTEREKRACGQLFVLLVEDGRTCAGCHEFSSLGEG